MSRPWHIWLAFGAGLGLVLAAMGWISVTVIRLDRNEQQARMQAQREENARLALWRMDSALAPIAAQESARPYFAYGSFYSADRPYGNMFNDNNTGKSANNETLLPSPLLAQAGPNALLHFQIDPAGAFSSPQVPTGNKVELALTKCATHEFVNASSQRLSILRGGIRREALLAIAPEPPAALPVAQVAASAAPNPPAPVQQSAPALLPQSDIELQQIASVQTVQQLEAEPQQRRQQAALQTTKNRIEYQKRSQSYQEQVKATQSNVDWASNSGNSYSNFPIVPTAHEVREGAMKAGWVLDNLVLVRRVVVNGKTYLQGCWLDWASIRAWLQDDVRDLLPEAALEPVLSENGDRGDYRLAALPVRLVPGAIANSDAAGWSPIQISLVIAWICVLLGAAAVAALLLGAVTLSERRGAFVSAVTHELRTPLTTFRMYTEMLSGGMVADEEKKQKYLHTLRVEAERLSHLVENVLSFARLERGAKGTRIESIALRELIARTRQRLCDRAEQAGMQILVEGSVSDFDALAKTDPSAIEQILFNLVDNACKYAARAETRVITIGAERIGGFVALRVSDRGPGFTATDRKRLFHPFSKSANEAAHSAPGVGLGLALSRRLARDMGGDLRLDSNVKSGASFLLTMPAGSASPAPGDAASAAHA